MQQFYEDGVERMLLWLGDFRVEYLCNVAAFGDADLARKCLFMIAASQAEDGAIPAAAAHGGGHQHPANVEYMPSIPFSSVADWFLLNYDADFISTVKEYIWHSGDRAILEDLWPCLKRLVTFLSSFELDRARAFDEYITDGFTSWAAMHLNIYWGMGDMLEAGGMAEGRDSGADGQGISGEASGKDSRHVPRYPQAESLWSRRRGRRRQRRRGC